MASASASRTGVADRCLNSRLAVVQLGQSSARAAAKETKAQHDHGRLVRLSQHSGLVFILAYNYHRNSEAITETLQQEVAKTRQASIENTEAMIHSVAGTLSLLAEMAAADPGFFRTEKSRDILYKTLTSAPEIDAAYVSFEDGYHRVVTRIDSDRRRSDPKIPSTANWHSSFIDDFSSGENRRRHRIFFDTWGHIVGGYDVATTMDIRAL